MRPIRSHSRIVFPLSAALLFCTLVYAQSPDPPLQGKATLVYIGTRGNKGKGIHLFRLQSAGTEVSQNVTLVPLGTKPCHLALDDEARNLLVTNCGDGSVAVLPIAADGKLGEATDIVKGAHAISVTLAGKFAFVCDPAADKVLRFSFDAQAGKLRPATPAFIEIKAESAPRQLLFRPDGKFDYVLNEKTSTINVFSYDAATGALTEVQAVSTVPESYDGANAAIELQIHHTGKWLYVSNTGHDSIVLFNVDREKGTLSYVEEQGTGGRHARQFGLQPNSMHMAISLPDNNQVLASRIDADNGRLKPSGIFAEMPAPATVRFLPSAGGEK